MKSDSQLIFERYAQSKQQFILESSIKDLYNYDMQCVYELMQEGAFSDTLSKFGQSVKGAASKVGSFVKGKLEQSFGALLAKMLPEEEKSKLAAQLQGLQKDPNKLKELQQQGMAELNKSSEASEEFAFESNKSFLVRTVFTQDNLEELFESFLLEEAARKKAARMKPTVKTTGPLVDQIVKQLQKKYKTPKSLQKGYDAFNNQLTKRLGVQPTTIKSASKATGSRGTGSKAVAPAPISPVDTEDTPNPEDGPLEREPISSLPERPVDTGSPAAPDTAAAPTATADAGTESSPQKEGLFKKAFNWVKKHPNLTAASVLAIVAALTVFTGGSLIPVVLGSLKGGILAGGRNAMKQKAETGKVDWGQAASSGLKGAAGGAAGGALVGAAADYFMGGEDMGVTEDELNSNEPSGGFHPSSDSEESGSFRDGIDSDSDPEDSVSAEPQRSGSATSDDPKGGEDELPSDVPVSDQDFSKYNGGKFNPKSIEDQTKRLAMDQLKHKYNGEIPASKYNALASKIHSFLKTHKGMSAEKALAQIDPTIFGESYTKGYLKFF
jgi:hypothetical protein